MNARLLISALVLATAASSAYPQDPPPAEESAPSTHATPSPSSMTQPSTATSAHPLHKSSTRFSSSRPSISAIEIDSPCQPASSVSHTTYSDTVSRSARQRNLRWPLRRRFRFHCGSQAGSMGHRLRLYGCRCARPAARSNQSHRSPQCEPGPRHGQGRLGSRSSRTHASPGPPPHLPRPTPHCATPPRSGITFWCVDSTHPSSPETIVAVIPLAVSPSRACSDRRGKCTAKPCGASRPPCSSAPNAHCTPASLSSASSILRPISRTSATCRYRPSPAGSITPSSASARLACASLPGWKEWDVSGSIVANLNDHSFTAVVDVSRWFGNHFSSYVHAEVPYGSSTSDFGATPYSAATSAGVRFHL